MCDSPFTINSLNIYQAWRTKKLAAYPLLPEQLLTPIQDPENPSEAELAQLQATCRQHNLALYRFMQGDLRSKRHVHRLGKKLACSGWTATCVPMKIASPHCMSPPMRDSMITSPTPTSR